MYQYLCKFWWNPVSLSINLYFNLSIGLRGYDKGILNRPKSFVEILSEAGFVCNGIAMTPFTSSLFGYNRGYSTFHDGFDILILVEHVLNRFYLDFYIDLVFEKKIPLSVAERYRKE